MKCNTARDVISNFDEVAELYDDIRPQYPVELIEAIAQAAGIEKGSRALELGSGSGQATAMLLPYGCSIDCVEPGGRLSEIARRKFSGHEVNIFTTRFEEWELGRREYDLVFSATAFHWIPAEIAYRKTAQALKPGGTVALFWNMHPIFPEVFDELLTAILKEEEPRLISTIYGLPHEEVLKEGLEELGACGLFEDITSLHFPWRQQYRSRELLDLLRTYANFQSLPQERLDRLMSRIAQAVESEMNEVVELQYLAALHLARKRLS